MTYPPGPEELGMIRVLDPEGRPTDEWMKMVQQTDSRKAMEDAYDAWERARPMVGSEAQLVRLWYDARDAIGRCITEADRE